ncbi:MAG TPA: RIP metalloprotease RseP [Bacteriovoracaceae bacterium]|nr:RIP metalloprotease RseP [Bacteriovoracaceae bacterium]
MFEKILIFIVFLAPLIFFHELGHFIFARLFGVRVEVFSIGFGPKLFKYLHKGTEYAVSAIPLGGYVKMFGDDPFSDAPLTEEEKKVAFTHKSKWARFWIVFGGPLANLILAYTLYVGLLTQGEKVPETKVGVVTEKSVLYSKGLRTGDVLTAINDEKVMSFDDFNIKGSSVEKISVRRKNETVVMPVDMELEPFINEFVAIVSVVKKPIFINKKGEQFYLSLTPKPTDLNVSLEEISSSFQGKAYLYSFHNPGDQLKLDHATESEITAQPGQKLTDLLVNMEYYPADLGVRNIVMSSPADKAGIKKGDILTKMNGKPLLSFEDLRVGLQEIPEGKEVQVEVLSKGETAVKNLIPTVNTANGKKTKIIGIESAVEYIQPKLIVAKADSFGAALGIAFFRTWDGVVKTFNGYKKLITREVSLNNIGGPLAIGKVASDSLNISLSMFFRLMAIISINLGVINLFPIPVLDGGHIMFLFFETLNGGPLSRRKLEIAQRFGVSVLFLLIFVAIFNDITRLF